MGAGHGSTRDGVGSSGGANPRREDVATGGKDVDDGTVVGVRGTGIGVGGGTNSAGRGRRGGRRVGSVGVLVSGSDSQENTSIGHGSNSAVDSSRGRATKRHVSNHTLGARSGLGVGSDVVHAGNNTRVGTGA